MTSLDQMINTLTADPKLGRRTLKAQATWAEGLTSQVVPDEAVKGSGGECLYAEDLLELYAKCIVFDVLAHGNHRGVTVGGVRVSIEGDIDFAGSVGLDAPVGFKALRINIDVRSGDAEDRVAEAAGMAHRCSIIGQSLDAVPQKLQIRRVNEIPA